MLFALIDHTLEYLTADEEAQHEALGRDEPKLRDLIEAALKRDAERNL
jgi:hypothetical protein